VTEPEPDPTRSTPPRDSDASTPPGPVVDHTQTPGGGHPRLIAFGEVLLCSGVPTQLVIAQLLALLGFPVPTAGQPLPPSFVVALSLTDTAVLGTLMVVLTRMHGERLRDLWLGPRSPWREALLGLSLIPALLIAVVILLNLLHLVAPWLRTVPENPLEQLATLGRMQALALAVVAIVAGGVREELQRAFVLVRFERHLGGQLTGVLVVSTVFGLLHAVQGADAMVVTGLLGAAWAVLYFRRRSVIAPLVSHAGFNALQVLRVAIVGG
jgi:membrane protease YdiL (CAAX protease family)